ncbi:uncharacterized protein TNCV_1875761 [Trichonephila clavipes]|nr:uncharacterized protein TNCV_1875761 [Trichonephila clavipes]
MQGNEIEVLNSPVNQPDLNPIRNLWHRSFKNRLAKMFRRATEQMIRNTLQVWFHDVRCTADAALPIESSEMEEFETKYYETKAKLQNILENLSVRTYVYNDNSDVFENVSNMKSSNFKLPKINIERFSGDYKDWPSFKDLYVSLVHDNMCLSNIQNFNILEVYCCQNQQNIIKHIPITETAYNEA